MTVRYHARRGELRPDYVCQQVGIQTAKRICQHIPGAGIDQAIGALLVETVTPVAMEVALQVQQGHVQAICQDDCSALSEPSERDKLRAGLLRERLARRN